MKNHSPTIHSEGYPFRRALSKGMLSYLTDEARSVYSRGHRTPEPEPETPPRIGGQIGDQVVYLREEVERVEDAAEEEACLRKERKKKRKAKKEKKKGEKISKMKKPLSQKIRKIQNL